MSTDDQSGGEYCNSCGKPAFACACSTDTLAALLAALKRQPHLGDNRLAAEWLATRGVVVLPADHPLRTGQPSEAMIEAARQSACKTGNMGVASGNAAALRAALAIIKEDLK